MSSHFKTTVQHGLPTRLSYLLRIYSSPHPHNYYFVAFTPSVAMAITSTRPTIAAIWKILMLPPPRPLRPVNRSTLAITCARIVVAEQIPLARRVSSISDLLLNGMSLNLLCGNPPDINLPPQYFASFSLLAYV